MKLLAGETPSVRNWFVWWGVGFISISLLGAVLCMALWLIGRMAVALGPPYPAIVLFPLLGSLRIVPLVAAAFGAYLATAMILQWRRNERIQRESAVRVSGFHPAVGPFEHAPFTHNWSAKFTLPTGHPIRLSGPGPEPSPAAVDVWIRFQACCEELLRVATDDLLQPGNPYDVCPVVTLWPWAIRLGADGSLVIDFEVETEPEHFPASPSDRACEIAPHARFTPALALERSEW